MDLSAFLSGLAGAALGAPALLLWLKWRLRKDLELSLIAASAKVKRELAQFEATCRAGEELLRRITPDRYHAARELASHMAAVRQMARAAENGTGLWKSRLVDKLARWFVEYRVLLPYYVDDAAHEFKEIVLDIGMRHGQGEILPARVMEQLEQTYARAREQLREFLTLGRASEAGDVGA